MKRWVTIFPDLKREHINKDVGLIPITMQKYFGYESYILTIVNTDNISNTVGCGIIETPKWLGKKKFGIMRYILKNAVNIDVLNLYHFSLLESLIWAFPFKLLKKKGKVYLKMDLSTKYMADYTTNKIMVLLRRCFLKQYDLISVESSIVSKYINYYYKNRVKLIPNGHYWEEEVSNSITKKKNELLHVARMGAECKCTEVLIEAFEMSLNKHNWRLRLVGTMEPDFKCWFDDKIFENEELKTRIIYQGEITDRRTLAEIYSEGSIFVLSSEYESFGIVLVEALSKGCFLLGTDGINSIADIVSNKKIGMVCRTNDPVDLSRGIVESIAIVQNETFEDLEYRKKYAEERYSWKNICQYINEELIGSKNT